MSKNALDYIRNNTELIEEYKDKVMYLIIDNKDWKRIVDAVVGYMAITIYGAPNLDDIYASLRCLTGTAYAMGYEHGKRVKNMPDFVVAPEMKGGNNDKV